MTTQYTIAQDIYTKTRFYLRFNNAIAHPFLDSDLTKCLLLDCSESNMVLKNRDEITYVIDVSKVVLRLPTSSDFTTTKKITITGEPFKDKKVNLKINKTTIIQGCVFRGELEFYFKNDISLDTISLSDAITRNGDVEEYIVNIDLKKYIKNNAKHIDIEIAVID